MCIRDRVLDALADPEKVVIVGCAPSVRAGLGEEFGYPIGTNVEGKLATALKLLGFDKVFDVNFAADMTIMEESNELIERVEKGGKLPIAELASGSGVERKTLERHRKYMVAMLLAFTNGFEIIRGHLCRLDGGRGAK